MATLSIVTVHFFLEGVTSALAIELFIRVVFICQQQQNQIRSLKIIMAVSMTIKSILFSFYVNSSGCGVTERVADAFYHVSCIAGFIILALRVEAVVPIQHQATFRILHIVLIGIRFVSSVLDVIYLRTWIDASCNCCQFEVTRELGSFYAIYDALFDIYVSVIITFILYRHIRKICTEGVQGNFNLYISVIVANVIRTIILSLISIGCAIYYLTNIRNPVLILIIWPVTNMFFIILIGYDTNITQAIKNMRDHIFEMSGNNMAVEPIQLNSLNVDQPNITKKSSFFSLLSMRKLSDAGATLSSTSAIGQFTTIKELQVSASDLATSSSHSLPSHVGISSIHEETDTLSHS
ncbi:MAG: hypothetical protein EXX96DRAFT_653175 [Benjaminiella poitrasii]|nr:MAG: hypothetical protein EXX96DRAFT_653175 [Benjaminiella poitrasii]